MHLADLSLTERQLCDCGPWVQVDFFDASGTLFSMANFINNFIPGARLLVAPLASHLLQFFL